MVVAGLAKSPTGNNPQKGEKLREDCKRGKPWMIEKTVSRLLNKREGKSDYSRKRFNEWDLGGWENSAKLGLSKRKTEAAGGGGESSEAEWKYTSRGGGVLGSFDEWKKKNLSRISGKVPTEWEGGGKNRRNLCAPKKEES